METQINVTRLKLVQGNIVAQDTEAIVNAANTGLTGGGGVDGAIHRAGGPQIMAECRQIGGCPTGDARITGGGNLAARYVIHAVGPFYSGRTKESDLLAGAYRNSLKLAAEHGIKSVAFPSISTGAYRYPLKDAAKIALSTVRDFLQAEPHGLERVRFVLFDAKTLAAYEDALQNLTS